MFQAADASENICQMNTVAHGQYNVDYTGKGIFFIDANIFNGGIGFGHSRCEGGNKSALRGDLYFEFNWELTTHGARPGQGHTFFRVIADFQQITA